MAMECPVCHKDLLKDTAAKATEHVNECLDKSFETADTLTITSTTTTPTRQATLNKFFGLVEPASSASSASCPTTNNESLLYQLKKRENDTAMAHKRVMGTNFVVDAFKDGPINQVQYYLLSHFHSDHYQGLNNKFDWGMIACSNVTANLVVTVLQVPEAKIIRLPLDEWIKIDDIEILLIDAFHCPGSVMFVFKIPSDKEATGSFKYILHTGDFRASPELIINNPILSKLDLHFDAIYLDTTYCDPQYVFPPQHESIAECCRVVDRLINKHDQRLFSPTHRLVLIGSYLIGKEKIAVAIAKLLNSRIYCSNRKRMILNCLMWPSLTELLTEDPIEAQVHLVMMGDLQPEAISTMLTSLWPKYTHALAIRPTGWSFTKHGALTFHDHVKRDLNSQTVKRKDAIAIYGTPYSEHSSFHELDVFLSTPRISYNWVIPTVDNPFGYYLKRSDHHSAEKLLLTWYDHKLKLSTNKGQSNKLAD